MKDHFRVPVRMMCTWNSVYEGSAQSRARCGTQAHKMRWSKPQTLFAPSLLRWLRSPEQRIRTQNEGECGVVKGGDTASRERELYLFIHTAFKVSGTSIVA